MIQTSRNRGNYKETQETWTELWQQVNKSQQHFKMAQVPSPEHTSEIQIKENLKMLFKMDLEQLTFTIQTDWKATIHGACVCADAG